LIAADMHQDGRTWEAVWQKNGIPPRSLDVSPLPEEMDLEQSEDIGSASEASEIRSAPSAKASVVAENEVLPIQDEPIRPGLPHRWSGEDETWDSMLSYIQKKCEEERTLAKEQGMEMTVDVTQETVNMDLQGADRDTIQRRMSIANLL